MKNSILTIRAVFAAVSRVFAAICPSGMNLKGGGGAEMTRRTILRVFAGVFAVASLFAADEANAQEVQFQVYAPTSGTIQSEAFYDIDIEGSLRTVADNLRTSGAVGASTNANYYFQRRNSDGVFVDPSGTPNNAPLVGGVGLGGEGGLPGIDGVAYQPGDVVRFWDNGGAAFSNQTFDFTVRLYTNPDDGEIYMAFGEVVPATLAAAVSGSLFFIDGADGEFVSSQIPAATNIGYEEPDCSDPDIVLGGDGLACVPKANCGPGTLPNEAENTCMCDEENGFMNLNADASPQICRLPLEPSDNDLQSILQIAAGAGVVAFFIAYAAGDATDFAFSPDVGYSINESGYAYNYGGRLDFNKDRWHWYWSAGQANTNGDFGDLRYASGGSYAADFWTAKFTEKAQGKTVDYDLSLSAKYGEGIWEVSPAYRVHFGFDETKSGVKSETENALNLEGVLRANRWTVRSTAGFRWESAEDFADNARFGISAVRNL